MLAEDGGVVRLAQSPGEAVRRACVGERCAAVVYRAEEAFIRQLRIARQLADAVEGHEHDAPILRLVHERARVHRAEEAVEYGFEFEEPGHTGLRVAPTLVLQLASVAVRTRASRAARGHSRFELWLMSWKRTRPGLHSQMRR